MKQYNVMLIRTPYVRALALAAGLAASTMTSIDVSIPATAQSNAAPATAAANAAQSPRDEERYKGADRPSSAAPAGFTGQRGRDEDRSAAAEREFDKKLEMKASERRPPFGAVVDPRGSVALN